MPKAVFAGCARSCAPFLDGVLANIETFGSIYDSFEIVIVENDSADDTRRALSNMQQSAATSGWSTPTASTRRIQGAGIDWRSPGTST